MKQRSIRIIAVLALITVNAALSGCADVKPWQRGNLARPEMSWDPNPTLAAFKEHIYFSKEASSGGTGAGGGGCGCN